MPNFLKKILLLLVATVSLAGCSLLDKKNVSGLQVITPDVDASLYLNGEYLDKTPFINREIKPGIYSLKIEPDDKDLAKYETRITLRKGTLTVVTWNPGSRPETSGGVTYELEKIGGNKGQLSFITIPDNALVSVDNAEADFSPLVTDDLEAGLHQFEISLTAYQTQQHSINVPAGYLVTVTAKLARSDGTDEADNVTVFGENTPKSTAQPLNATPSGTVTILPTNFYQADVEVLRVRSAPGLSGNTLGFAEVGKNYTYLNEEQSDWLKIQFEEQPGWISSQFAHINE